MTDEDKASLKAWAKNWYEGIGQVQARQALELLAENEQLQALNVGLADRVAAQSELKCVCQLVKEFAEGGTTAEAV